MTGEPQLALPIGVQDDGELRTYQLVVPFLPMSKNKYDGMPGQWQHGVKTRWVRRITEECERLQVPHGNARIGLAARLWFATNRRRDVQNYSQTLWHWVPDALVRCGVLLDDQQGSIQFGSGGNLGIQLFVDTRKAPASKLERTELALTLHLRPDGTPFPRSRR